MTGFDWLKNVHIACALVSIAGFALRGYWVLADHPARSHALTRRLPHVVDTLLLASALGMLWLWQLSPFTVGWLQAKLAALLLYIGLGVVLMRGALNQRQRWGVYLAALATAGYIVTVAISHSPWGPLALWG